MTWRTPILAFLAAAALWFAASILVGGFLIAHGVATRDTVVSMLLCVAEFGLVAWVFGLVRGRA